MTPDRANRCQPPVCTVLYLDRWMGGRRSPHALSVLYCATSHPPWLETHAAIASSHVAPENPSSVPQFTLRIDAIAPSFPPLPASGNSGSTPKVMYMHCIVFVSLAECVASALSTLRSLLLSHTTLNVVDPALVVF